MNRIALYLAGPEMIWALLLAITIWIGASNQPPTLAGNQRLELLGWILPSLGVMLSFGVLAWAPGNVWLWLLRIVLVGTIGVGVLTNSLCKAIDYGDSRNSGVGTAFLLFISIGLMTLFIGVVLVTAVQLFK